MDYSLDNSFGPLQRFLNKRVLCAWLLSGALEILRLWCNYDWLYLPGKTWDFFLWNSIYGCWT